MGAAVGDLYVQALREAVQRRLRRAVGRGDRQRHEGHRRGGNAGRSPWRYGESMTVLHPDLGHIDMDAQYLCTQDRAQTMVVLAARPGTDSQGKLELLSVIGHQQLAPLTRHRLDDVRRMVKHPHHAGRPETGCGLSVR
ncbi:hypothetical protein [Streptomyces sp. NPDC048825]|uniref:MmyB family transcriptional regulator n=1 Tax=Streptomyces sp. NPDC048825 TaxID=3365592 RepID=UPI003716F9B0